MSFDRRGPKQEGRLATIADVARESGVSKGTVSHVISGRVRVSPQMRAKVEAAIEALNYHPAETARSLNARKRLSRAEHYRDGSTPRLTTVGYVSVDHIACVDRLPEREERRLASAILKLIGGPAANVASIAAGLGEPFGVRSSILTTIGDDQESDWAATELAGRGVGVIAAGHKRGARLNRAIVLVEADGRRTIVNEPLGLGEVDVLRFLEEAHLEGGKWCLHFEGYQVPSQMHAAASAREAGFITSMHAPGLQPGWLAENASAVLAGFDIVTLHRESLAAFPGCPTDPLAALDHIASLAGEAGPSPQVLVVTLGGEGAAVRKQGGECAIVPAPSVTVRDLTGAGDAFVGAFLAQYLNDVDALEAARGASVAGSLCVTTFGAAEMRPTAAMLSSSTPADAIRAG